MLFMLELNANPLFSHAREKKTPTTSSEKYLLGECVNSCFARINKYFGE
jgi:hypothetical protein